MIFCAGVANSDRAIQDVSQPYKYRETNQTLSFQFFPFHLNEFLLDLRLSHIDWVKEALARREQVPFRDPLLSWKK